MVLRKSNGIKWDLTSKNGDIQWFKEYHGDTMRYKTYNMIYDDIWVCLDMGYSKWNMD